MRDDNRNGYTILYTLAQRERRAADTTHERTTNLIKYRSVRLGGVCTFVRTLAAAMYAVDKTS